MNGAKSFLPLVAVIASLLHGGAAFSSSRFAKGARSCSLHSLCRQSRGFSGATTTTSLAVKKRRKRRNEESSSAPLSDELPDFDMDYEPTTEMETSASVGADVLASGSLMDSMDYNDPNLNEAMKGSAMSEVESAKDLLRGRDRSLEQAFEFDEVPSLLPSIQDKTAAAGPGTGGKKRARAEARKEAAIQAAEEENTPSLQDLIAELPFVGKRPGEKMTAIKVSAILFSVSCLTNFILYGMLARISHKTCILIFCYCFCV
jgi:hypothetical protein